ncbi:MAG: CRISPR-associated protein Cas4 [Acidobacteriota bacterium]
MKLSQNFSKQLEKVEGMYLTPSEIIEYLYCPRFIYFMNCLNISQHEEQRYKVLLGREIHEGRKRVNRNYLRKKINCTGKDINVYMVSENFHLKGTVDEVLYLEDGTLAPFDYKFAEFKETLYRTHKVQSVLYGLLIKDFYKAEVKKGYICYVRDNYLVKEIPFKEKDFIEAQMIIDEMFSIIQLGFYPKKTKYSIRCVDCCYRNICV